MNILPGMSCCKIPWKMGNNACSKDDVASGFVLQTILEKNASFIMKNANREVPDKNFKSWNNQNIFCI